MDDYWLSLINDAASFLSSDPKRYWMKFRQLRGTYKGSIRITDNGLPGGGRLVKDTDKATSFRGVFAPRFATTNIENIAQDSKDKMDVFFAGNPGICLPYPLLMLEGLMEIVPNPV